MADANLTPDQNPLATLGSSPLERIYQQLVIITMLLGQAFNINDESYTFFPQNRSAQAPNISSNFTESL